MATEHPHPAERLLPDGEVHVWHAALDAPAAEVERLYAVLSPAERRRAGRFHFPRDRRCYIVARGRLREILSRYLGSRPAEVSLAYGPYGKPYVAPRRGRDGVQFNLSHAGGLVLYAITRGRYVGIDVEQMRPIAHAEALAKRFFSEREYAVLSALPPSRRAAAFLTCWTRKEAYIKARGEGLSHPLDTFDVAFLPDEPAALLETRSDPDEATRWWLWDCSPAPGYVATLAVEGPGARLVHRRWPEAQTVHHRSMAELFPSSPQRIPSETAR